MAEAELILRPKIPTAAETWDLVDAQQNGYDAGLELYQAACSAQTLLSASGVQYYTDVDGRTPLFKVASKGHALIVAQLIIAHCNIHCNVDLAMKTNGATPLVVAAKKRHAVVEQLITALCKIDLALKNGLTAISIATRNGHTRVMARTQNFLTCPNTDYLHAAGGAKSFLGVCYRCGTPGQVPPLASYNQEYLRTRLDMHRLAGMQ
jgi:hypothetical protein